ncbi:MAG: helix-turn-helix domain-containing protein [Rhodospirillaceae bacterium]
MRHPGQLWIAAKVRSRRIQRGLTQGELARALGKPQSFISKLETAERRLDFLEAVRLAQVLGFDILELVPPEDWDDEESSDYTNFGKNSRQPR